MGNVCHTQNEPPVTNLNFGLQSKPDKKAFAMRGNLSDISVSNYNFDRRTPKVTPSNKKSVSLSINFLGGFKVAIQVRIAYDLEL